MECQRATRERSLGCGLLTAYSLPPSLLKKEDRIINRILKAKSNSVKKLSILYSVMNEIFTHIHNFTPCKKGCSNCCHFNVTISEVEIKFIEEKEGIKRNLMYKPSKNFNSEPCTFLGDDQACTIYNSRPYVCRRMTSTMRTEMYCDSLIASDKSVPLLSFSGLDTAYDLIRQEVKGGEKLQDIRQVFGGGVSKFELPDSPHLIPK